MTMRTIEGVKSLGMTEKIGGNVAERIVECSEGYEPAFY